MQMVQRIYTASAVAKSEMAFKCFHKLIAFETLLFSLGYIDTACLFQVRHSSAKCLEAIVSTRPELLVDFYQSVSIPIIARFKVTLFFSSSFFSRFLS